MWFTRILMWIREALNKMIDTSSIKSSLNVDIAISSIMADALQTWTLMYENNASWLNEDVHSMHLPAAIASEIARLATIEMKAEISGGSRSVFLQEQMDRVVPQLREKVEFGCAKGGLMFKPYPDGYGGIAVDFVQADQFYPVSFDTNGCITSCVFMDQKVMGNKYYTRLEYHSLNNSLYTIINRAFMSMSRGSLGSPIALSAVNDWGDLEEESTIKNVKHPLFAYFRYPMANHVDSSSPLGVSCYSRSVNLIEQADKLWSNLLWEFESGERAIFVDAAMFGKNKDGTPRLPRKRLYRTLESNSIDKDFFQQWTPEFRDASILNGLDAILKKIEFNCGLAAGTISDPQQVEQTATEIKIGKQRTYATITDTQKVLKKALDDLLYAMDAWTTLYKLAPVSKYESMYSFDDSIVADYDTQYVQDTTAITLGVMSKVEFRVRNYGETEEVAKQKIAMILQDGVGSTDLFNQGA